MRCSNDDENARLTDEQASDSMLDAATAHCVSLDGFALDLGQNPRADRLMRRVCDGLDVVALVEIPYGASEHD